jgi:DDE superfamily endonuclease
MVVLRTGINNIKMQEAFVEFVARELGPDEMFLSSEYSRRCTRLAAVLRAAKRQVVPIASTRQLRRWWYYFLRYGDTPARRSQLLCRYGKKYNVKRRRKTDWTHHHTAKLKEVVTLYPELYLDEIQDQLIERGLGRWSTSWLWKKLNSDCNYSLQVATDRSYDADEEERNEYQQAINTMVAYPEMLVYLDESQKDRNSSRRRRMWSKRGQSPFRTAYFDGSHRKRYTLLAACDIDGFIFEACETVEQSRGVEDGDMTRGTIDTERFNMWVEEKLIPTLGRYEDSEPRSIVVMDNATIHSRAKEVIEAAGAKVIFLPPYSPDLNPIELMFGEYKKTLKRNSNRSWYVAVGTATVIYQKTN